MRIGIDARMLGSAPGIGRYIERLMDELFRVDRESEYILFLREPMLLRYQVPGTRFRKVHAPERWYSLAEQVTWPWRLRRARLDLLFVPQFNVPLFVPCPFVVTIHDVTQLFMPGPKQGRSRFRRAAFRLVFSRAVRRARAVIAVSEYTKGEIVKNFHIDPVRIRVIYEGGGLALRRQEDTRYKKQDTNTFRVPRGEYILAAGVWRPHKNFVGLLDAFAELKRDQRFSRLRLVLAGEEDSRYPEVRERISALGLSSTVVTPGTPGDEELLAWYRHASVVVVPSFYEGFGFVGLEALASGVPVAASRAAALPEILGDAAAYFHPRDTGDMAETIVRVLTDESERARILAAAPAVLARYSWRRAAEQTLAVFGYAYSAK